MTTHLTDEELLERMQTGGGSGDGTNHASACAFCQRRLAEMREVWRLAAEAEVPEPSPLYWEAFRRQVGHRLAQRPAAAWRSMLTPFLALATAVLLALGVFFFERHRQPSAASGLVDAMRLPAWSALPDPEADPGLVVLRALAPSGALQATVECGLADSLAELSEDESRALAEVLRVELGGRES